MEPLTTQTFGEDKTEEPQSAPPESGTVESGTVESGTADTLAVPFRDFPISDEICRGLEAAGIFTTFPIQALTLPLAFPPSLRTSASAWARL